MACLGKVALLIVVMALAVSGFIVLAPVRAAVPVPSVPVFTLKFVDNSYNVPTTYSIDPFTGENVTHQGYYVDNVDLVMIIQNQPLVNNYSGSFFYNIRAKGHYAENWTQLYLNDMFPVANASSAQTLVTIGSLGSDAFGESGLIRDYDLMVPSGGKEDFQVQAMIGGFFKAGFDHTEFSGESSDWSTTQTVTISNSATPTPTAMASQKPASSVTPQYPGVQTGTLLGASWMEVAVVLVVVVACLAVGMVALWRRVAAKH
jgi:hypothetical protein